VVEVFEKEEKAQNIGGWQKITKKKKRACKTRLQTRKSP
jgi:hypothetical protein